MNIKSDKQDLVILNNSPLMDERWYAMMYGVDQNQAIEHYCTIGWKHLFDPSLQFSTQDYLQDYPDVAQAGVQPLVHFEVYGRREGRSIRPSRFATPCLWKGKSKTGISRACYAPQSQWQSRPSLDELMTEARKYNYISFDVFDTLVLRKVERPTDVFRIMGAEMEAPRFAKVRIESEQECYRLIGVSTNIYDIYARSAGSFFDSIESAIDHELDCELRLCYANPYMKLFYEALQKEGIPIILVSDMYWTAEQLERILTGCGYRGWEKLYVSCDEGKVKSTGLLQLKAWEDIGKENSVLHIGDNYDSDVIGSELMGWNSFYYPNCRDKSPIFYDPSEKTLPTSIANAIWLNRLNNGMENETKEFEHGFLYGGILTCGFCQWLEEFAQSHGIEQIWFLARDMDIVSKIYRRFYNKVSSRYVRVSRSAMLELNVKEDPELFFFYHFQCHIGVEHYDISTALHEARLDNLLSFTKEYNLKPDMLLTPQSCASLRRLFYDHLDEACDVFSSAVEGATAYFTNQLNGRSKICVVDLGWNGTILVELNKFMRHHKLPVDKAYYVMMGANNSQMPNDMISTGMLYTYLFSGSHNIEMALPSDTLRGNTEIMCLEAMFSSDQPTLKNYDISQSGEPILVDGIATSIPMEISEIQRGIWEFTEAYVEHTASLRCRLHISPEDAFRPYLSVAEDFQYLYLLFNKVAEIEDGSIATDGESRTTTIGAIMEKRGLV
ncbi:MAG: hypothetical protein LUH07_07645 [Lachnospiraceae bacterium]|nr:hypothetical protein [Lachnospiraceae bacterium]